MQEERQPMGSESLGTLLRSWRDGTFSEIWDDWKWIWGYTKRYRRAVWFYTILGGSQLHAGSGVRRGQQILHRHHHRL